MSACAAPVVSVLAEPLTKNLKQVTAENLAWHDHQVPFHAGA